MTSRRGTLDRISKFANIPRTSSWQITYYKARVQRDIWAMGGSLFELRPKGPEGIGWVFYCTQVGKTIVVLHSFVKKTQETPDTEMRLARKRLKDVQHG
jgi:phage-related protein